MKGLLPLAVATLGVIVAAGVALAAYSVAQAPGLPSPAPQLAQAAEAPAPARRVEILAVGDVMPSRWVERRLREHGYGYPFASTSAILSAADVAFANLESPLAEGDPVEGGQMNFRGDPAFAAALASAGFDVVSLANNHMGDRGEDGIESTLRALEGADVAAVGAGRSIAAARAPRIVVAPEGSVAFLAYADERWIPDSYVATGTRAGVTPLDPATIESDVYAASFLADYVVVSMHAGSEYQETPDAVQRAAAEAAARAGATLVIGHHPHVLQPIERMGSTTVAWSLGNFVFDQSWSSATTEGAIASFDIEDGTVRARVLPVRIFDYAQPRPILGESDARSVAARVLADPVACPDEDGMRWWCEGAEK